LERILVNEREVEGGLPFRLNQGDVITLELPGGGGFGAPEERSQELRDADIRDGLA